MITKMMFNDKFNSNLQPLSSGSFTTSGGFCFVSFLFNSKNKFS